MIKNLFVEKYLHDLRITNIIAQSEKLGCDDCQDITVWIDLIKDKFFDCHYSEYISLLLVSVLYLELFA